MNRYCYENKMYDIKLNNLEKAIMEEIIMIMDCNYDEDLEKFEKTDILEIARDIIATKDELWELLNVIICRYLDREMESEVK